jgi:hypothetical protein
MHGCCLISAVPGPPGELPPTTSGDTPTTEKDADTRAEAPSGELIGNTNVFIQVLQTRRELFYYNTKWKTNVCYIHLCGMKIWFIRRKVEYS